MSIHHATVKSAEKAGIRLEALPDDQYRAIHEKTNYSLLGTDPKMLVKDMIALVDMKTNYRSASASYDEGQWTVSSPWGEFTAFHLVDAISLMKRAFTEAHQPDDEDEESEMLEAEEAEEEAEAEEDPQPSGDVVKPEYRARYTENGSGGRGCNDWMMQLLDEMIGTGKHLNVEAMDRLAQLNNINLDKYSRTSRGWQGRLRMTFRNILARKVWKEGFLINFNEEKVNADPQWVAEQKYKG